MRTIEWLSRQPLNEQQRDFSPLVRIPARQSVAQQTEFWSKLDPQTAEAYRWAIENSGTLPNTQFDYTVIGALGQAVSAVTSDPKANARQALADAQRQIRESIAQRELTPSSAGTSLMASPRRAQHRWTRNIRGSTSKTEPNPGTFLSAWTS